MDRFYLHRAGLVPKCSFPVSLIPISREQSNLASGMLFKVASLLFNIRGVRFQLPCLPELLLTFMNRAFIQIYPSGLPLLCTVCSHGTTGNMRSGFIFFPVPALFFNLRSSAFFIFIFLVFAAHFGFVMIFPVLVLAGVSFLHHLNVFIKYTRLMQWI